MHTDHATRGQVERYRDVGQLFASLDGNEQIRREPASFVVGDRRHPSHGPLPQRDAQRTASSLPHPAFPFGGVRPGHDVDHAAVSRTVAAIGLDMRGLQCGDEPVDLASMKPAGAAPAALSAERTDRPRRECRERADRSEQREHRLAEHCRHQSGAAHGNRGADETDERRGPVLERWLGHGHEGRGRIRRPARAPPHDTTPRVTVGVSDAPGAECHRCIRWPVPEPQSAGSDLE